MRFVNLPCFAASFILSGYKKEVIEKKERETFRAIFSSFYVCILSACWISLGMCSGSFSRSASIVIIIECLASFMPWSRPLVWPSLVLITATSAGCLAVWRVPSGELSSTTIISCGIC